MKWVKATERIPADDNVRHVRINGIPKLGNFFEHGNTKAFYVQIKDMWIIEESGFYRLEWLDESPSPDPDLLVRALTKIRDLIREERDRSDMLDLIDEAAETALNNYKNK